MEIKTTLKKLLNDQDMTLAQLSRATKVPIQTLSNWMQGMKPRDIEQVQTVAKHFKVTLDYLVSGKAAPNEPDFMQFKDEINAGVFEVVLRRVKR